MGMFEGFEVSEKMETGDSLGAGAIPTDVYDFMVDMAYVDESKGGAMSVNFTFKSKEGLTLKQTVYVTSGKEKGKLNYYKDKAGNKRYLPGFTTANDIALFTVGKDLSTIETETKQLKLYDFDAKKGILKKMPIITDMLGKEITLGVKRVNEPKYNDPSVMGTINEIDKVFNPDTHLTVSELRAEETEAKFYTKWVEKNQGKDRNKGKLQPAGNAAAKPATSLFNS